MHIIRKGLRFFLCAAFLFVTVAQPLCSSPVWAGVVSPENADSSGPCTPTIDVVNTTLTGNYIKDRLAAFAAEFKWLAEIVTVLSNIYALFKEYLGEINEKAETDAILMTAAYKTQTAIITQLLQALQDQNAKRELDKAKMRLYVDHTLPKHEMLCKKSLAHQAAKTTEAFESAIYTSVMTSLLGEGSGPKEDYNGVLYAVLVEKLRCQAGFGSIIDGYDDSCRKETENDKARNPWKRLYTDADLLASTLDGAVTLEVPEFEQKVVTLEDGTTVLQNVPNPQNFNQWMWVGGYYFCHQLAGWHPSPPYGEKALKTPKGSEAFAATYKAQAHLGANVQACAKLLAHMTRPNASSVALREEQNKRCKTIEGMIDEDAFKYKFDECKSGLSGYQAAYINNLMCKTPHYYLTGLEAGATHPEMGDAAIMCATSWNEWMAREAAMQGRLVKVVEGIQRSRGTWAGVGR